MTVWLVGLIFAQLYLSLSGREVPLRDPFLPDVLPENVAGLSAQVDDPVLVALIAAKREKAGFSQLAFSKRLGPNSTTCRQLGQGRPGLLVTELIEAARLFEEDPAQWITPCLKDQPID